MIVLGKIFEPYGVQGWVKVHAFADDPAAWAKIPIWWLARENTEDWQQFGLKACRLHGEGLVCQFEGFADRTAAEKLRGMLIGAPRETLPATAEDEFYWADLIGMEVTNTSGEVLGRVEGLIETGANSVLRLVSEDGKERLLPFVSNVVLAVEQEKACIRVDWGSDW
ncbi:MAG: rRNA processing protein RimM [Proteobacteria bacterium]|nr:rRNA processing protein RimM [Pseudomonadota bacterium]